MRVAKVRARYLPFVSEWHATTFPGTQPHEDTEWWLVWDGDKAVAFAGAVVEDDVLHLERVYVAKSHRGQGLQKRLIRTRCAWGRKHGAKTATTYTWGGNLPSMNSLISSGFRMSSRKWDGERSWITWEKALR